MPMRAVIAGVKARNAAPLEKIQHQLEMLQFFDGDGVEFPDAAKKIPVFFEIQGCRGGLALKMGVVHQHGGEIGQHFRQPIGGNVFAEQEHERLSTSAHKVTSGKGIDSG